MKLLVITNRNIEKSRARDESLFGEGVNVKGPAELRLAWVEKQNDRKWDVRLIAEKRRSPDKPPSKSSLETYLEELKGKACVFFVHGFNRSFAESLDQANEISRRYDVGVVAFSWPSNPGGWIEDEYKKAKAIALSSVAALDRTFEGFCGFLDENAAEFQKNSINLLIHSLGNYMFENLIRNPIFSGETRVFDNIVLNAADVDLKGHDQWTNRLTHARRVYATINVRDWVLGWSRALNPNRLGNAGWDLTSDRLVYFDVTDGQGVGEKHEHFGATAADNRVVHTFFRKVLHGEQGFPIDGATFDRYQNAYILDEREEPEEEGDTE